MATFERERITVDNSVKTLNASHVLAYRSATITVEDDQIRFTIDGTDPVAATTGHLLSVGDTLILQDEFEMQGFKAIRETSDAVIEVSYRGE